MSLSRDLLQMPPAEDDLRLSPSDDAVLAIRPLKSRSPEVALVHGATAGTLILQDDAGASLLASSAVTIDPDGTIVCTFKTSAFAVPSSPDTPVGRWWLTLSDGTLRHLSFVGRVFGVRAPA